LRTEVEKSIIVVKPLKLLLWFGKTASAICFGRSSVRADDIICCSDPAHCSITGRILFQGSQGRVYEGGGREILLKALNVMPVNL
jgi:hypothetical protein